MAGKNSYNCLIKVNDCRSQIYTGTPRLRGREQNGREVNRHAVLIYWKQAIRATKLGSKGPLPCGNTVSYLGWDEHASDGHLARNTYIVVQGG